MRARGPIRELRLHAILHDVILAHPICQFIFARGGLISICRSIDRSLGRMQLSVHIAIEIWRVRGQVATKLQCVIVIKRWVLSYHHLVATCELISVTSPPGRVVSLLHATCLLCFLFLFLFLLLSLIVFLPTFMLSRAGAADQKRGSTQDGQQDVGAKRVGTQPQETKNPTRPSQKRGRTQEPEKDVRANREATSQKAIQRRGRTQHPQQDAKPIHLFLLRSPGKCFRFLSPCFSLFRDLVIRASNRACDLKFLRGPADWLISKTARGQLYDNYTTTYTTTYTTPYTTTLYDNCKLWVK